MLRLPSLTALCLALAASTGCGVYVHVPTPEPPAWPIRLADDARGAQRPTALVRRRALDDQGQPLRGMQSMDRELPGLPEGSGLFSQVTHQPGLHGFAADADYTLDFSLEENMEASWYTALGLIPGVPLVGGWNWNLECVVLDHERELLGVVEVERRGVLVASVALLPFNLVFTLLPGSWLGFDLINVAVEQREMLDGMLKQALAEADRRFRFAAIPSESGHAAPD